MYINFFLGIYPEARCCFPNGKTGSSSTDRIFVSYRWALLDSAISYRAAISPDPAPVRVPYKASSSASFCVPCTWCSAWPWSLCVSTWCNKTWWWKSERARTFSEESLGVKTNIAVRLCPCFRPTPKIYSIETRPVILYFSVTNGSNRIFPQSTIASR